MCGIVGAFSFVKQGLYSPDVDIFLDLLKVSVLRGEHGTGIFYVGDKNTGLCQKKTKLPFVSWVKSAGTPYELFASKEYQGVKNDFQDSRFLVGHTRYATRGEKSVANAHPFSHEHITMVHNGTLFNVMGFDDYRKFAVDSDALCHALAEKPAKEVLENIVGAAAIVWYDEKRQKLCLYRNSERPLAYARIGHFGYLASELPALKWIVGRHATVKEEDEFFNIPPFMLWEFSHDDRKPHVTKIDPVLQVHYNKKGAPIIPVWAEPKPAKTTISPPATRTAPLPFEKEDGSEDRIPLLPRTPATTSESTTTSKFFSVSDYWGMRRGRRVVFSPENIDFFAEDQKRGKITGRFVTGMEFPMVSSMLKDVKISMVVKANKPEEISSLWHASHICADIVSLVMNKDDVSDVRAYVVDPTIISKDEADGLIAKWKNSTAEGMH